MVKENIPRCRCLIVVVLLGNYDNDYSLNIIHLKLEQPVNTPRLSSQPGKIVRQVTHFLWMTPIFRVTFSLDTTYHFVSNLSHWRKNKCDQFKHRDTNTNKHSNLFMYLVFNKYKYILCTQYMQCTDALLQENLLVFIKFSCIVKNYLKCFPQSQLKVFLSSQIPLFSFIYNHWWALLRYSIKFQHKGHHKQNIVPNTYIIWFWGNIQILGLEQNFS